AAQARAAAGYGRDAQGKADLPRRSLRALPYRPRHGRAGNGGTRPDPPGDPVDDRSLVAARSGESARLGRQSSLAEAGCADAAAQPVQRTGAARPRGVPPDAQMRKGRPMISIVAALLIAQAGVPRTTEGAAKEKQDVPGERRGGGCADVPSADDLRKLLKDAPAQAEVGGMASGKFEWAAVVDRSGQVCAVVVSTDDPTAAWPGSQAIAIAKAYTANAFSTDSVPMSTARLYTMSLPGHSLWGAARSTSAPSRDRKSTRLNSSHVAISYAVFCLKK